MEAQNFCQKIDANFFPFSLENGKQINQELAIEITTAVICKRMAAEAEEYVEGPTQPLHLESEETNQCMLWQRLWERTLRFFNKFWRRDGQSGRMRWKT